MKKMKYNNNKSVQFYTSKVGIKGRSYNVRLVLNNTNRKNLSSVNQ